jgi:CRP-like cAMP-binding protein
MKPTPASLSCQDCPSRKQGIYCTLEAEELQHINEHRKSRCYPKGRIIFFEGKPANGMYCINRGRVKVYKTGLDGRQQIVRLAGPGALLGYRALLSEEPYHASAETLEEAVVCCIDKAAFSELLTSNPDFSRSMIKKLATELRQAEDLATSIAYKSVRERMAELLLMLKDNYGTPTDEGVLIDLRLSREEMAEMIGVTQETAIRLLSEFKKDGLIAVKARNITLRDIPTLLKTASLGN